MLFWILTADRVTFTANSQGFLASTCIKEIQPLFKILFSTQP